MIMTPDIVFATSCLALEDHISVLEPISANTTLMGPILNPLVIRPTLSSRRRNYPSQTRLKVIVAASRERFRCLSICAV